MASTESTILAAIKTIIDGLSMTTSPEQVAIRKWPFDKGRDKDHWYPGITIHRVRDSEFAGTNERDDIGYGVGITMVTDNSSDPTEDDLHTDWQEKVRKAFIHKPLSTIATVCTCLVEPGPEYQNVPENYDVSALTIRVISRETRT